MRACAYARDLTECTWGEETVVYIDALLVFLKKVVRFREKVDGFPTFCGANSKIQLVRSFFFFLEPHHPKCRMNHINASNRIQRLFAEM